MSARPFVPRLADEELDLLISRSLDGDLSPEEEHDLGLVLAHDPAAAKRKEELARIVAEAAALPAPAPPFAFSTRVNSNVSEKGTRGGFLAHRFGFYPPPGMAVGAMALLAIVAVAITVLRPTRRDDGPVDVFFTDVARNDAKVAAKPASPPAAESKAKAREPRQNEIAETAPREKAPAPPAAVVASSEEALKDVGKRDAEKKLASPASAQNEPVLEAEKRPLAKAEADTVTAARPSAPAPALAGAAPQAAGAVASRSRANVEPGRSWSVAVRGDGARRWMLRSAPEGRPSAASSQKSAFRISLDADGRVTSVRALDARPVQPALLAFVRGLVFAPLAAEVEGYARDERAKAERGDVTVDRTAAPASEIDVEVSTR